MNRLLRILAVAALILMTLLAPTTARAAVIDGAITNVTLSPNNAGVWETLRLDLTWQVPDGSRAGDTFSLQPSDNVRVPNGLSFELRDPAGNIVATATSDANSVVTFTLTSYAESHIGVNGSAWFEANWNNNVVTPGSTQPVTFTVNGQSGLFPQTLAVSPSTDPAATGYKWMKWITAASERPDPMAAIQWGVVSPVITADMVGQSITLIDTPGSGQEIMCTQIYFTGSSWPWQGFSCNSAQVSVAETVRPEWVGGSVTMQGYSRVTNAQDVYENFGQTTIAGNTRYYRGTAAPPAAGGAGTGTVINGSLTLTKQAVVNNNVTGGAGTDVGDQIRWEFDITNTGNVQLSPLTVTDPKAGAIMCPVDILAPTKSTTCVAANPYTITPAEGDAGIVTNNAQASGLDPAGNTHPSNISSTQTTVNPTSSLSLVKSDAVKDVNRNRVNDPGDTIVWSFKVTNTGNVSVDNLSINDAMVPTVTCPVFRLAPRGTTTCRAVKPYTITPTDADRGNVANVATASGTELGGAIVNSAESRAVSDVTMLTAALPPTTSPTVVVSGGAIRRNPMVPATGVAAPAATTAATTATMAAPAPTSVAPSTTTTAPARARTLARTGAAIVAILCAAGLLLLAGVALRTKVATARTATLPRYRHQ